MADKKIERIEEDFHNRYKIKKTVNLIISVIITILGAVSFLYIWNYDKDGILTFRWMTVDGTVFTTVISFAFVAVNLLELLKYTELTSVAIYYARLASAVAEGLILVVVLLSQLPFSPEHMHIFRFDMFNMHIAIPLLMICSFVLNDSPIGRLGFLQILRGTWFVTLYAAVIITLIVTGAIPSEQIPYFFLDVFHMPAIAITGCFIFIYSLGYVLSAVLSNMNRKLSWVWFKDIAFRDRKHCKTTGR